jgi:hypothetical protein
MSGAGCLTQRTLLSIPLVWLPVSNVHASAPQLYSQPAYQSPVSAGADDLLFLAGDGLGKDDVVVYKSDDSTTEPIEHPAGIPADSTPKMGLAAVVSAAGAPYQLTVRLPSTLLGRQSYRIWVRNGRGEWSNAIRINDARALWFSPNEVYSTAALASLPRVLKVIGRNLEPRGSAALAIRLRGPEIHDLPEADDKAVDHAVRDFVSTRRLPDLMVPGDYHVEIRTESARWIEVPGATLRVIPDSRKLAEFAVSDPAFGGCRADDGLDDTGCIVRAVEAARKAGGGVIVLGAGTWDVTPGLATLPSYVELRGAGAHITKVVRHDPVIAAAYVAVFTLLGHNVVRGISFSDAREFAPPDLVRPILQIGRTYSSDREPNSTSATTSDVVITKNEFDRTYGAIVDGGSAIRELFVTYNQFGDYHLALDLGGNRYNVASGFEVDDSIIAYNRFSPGSYVDLNINQGVMASRLGAGRRVDFSSNVADGTDRHYLYPADPTSGWRAAFFWHMNNNQEMLLISDNTVSCSGDKAGDGEAIALDGNANTFALPATREVVRSTQDSVTIAGPLKATQNSRPIDVNAYYAEHWIRVDDGPGIGQSRKIAAYHIDADTSEATFTITPPWDVRPRPKESTISVARQYWQTIIVGNRIDQRSPPCTKANRTRPKGGVITVWAETTDSVVAGNRQFDTDGIIFQQQYVADDRSCPTCAYEAMPAFLAIRGNTLDGEYDWHSACSLSGIMGSYAASPTPRSPPPGLSFGVSISHNRIRHADGLYGGAIDVGPTWYEGPPGYSKALVKGLVVDHNEIRQISGAPPAAACGYTQTKRSGIHLQGGSHLDSTVLYMNTCDDVSSPLIDRGAHTLVDCSTVPPNSCECGRTN